MQDGDAKHLLDLSDVCSTLSDVSSENGDFAGAAEELRKGLAYLARLPETDLRRCGESVGRQ